MAKKQPIITKKEAPISKPVVERVTTSSKSYSSSTSQGIIFKKENYGIMLAGIGILIIGFIVMALDKEPYGFGFFGLTLGPVILIVGFAVQFWAIFYKSKRA
ncbi:MAG: DUF3098 domain-containing protein [Cytophagales bacterium]|nr:DUF3098 domain-containing protein [Cytophagales bacterium]